MATTIVRANAIQELARHGQSLWLDNIRRQLITSGDLARLRDEGVTGVTSNPTIFEKAVSGSTDYDEALVALVRAGRKPDEILWDLMVEDIQGAAEVFGPVYERTRGADGFVSIEVAPALAHDTRRTIAMARELHRRCDRPNVMVKIPATRQGLPAIRHMIGEGKNTNVTLIFAVERYAEVTDAYFSGLEDLLKRGGDPSRVASVASFFVSRVDTKVDRLLQRKIEGVSDPARRQELEALLGKAGIANSKMAYQRFLGLHSGPRWEALRQAGARPQRCLWASTSTKDPRYPDTMYVEELIGPDTVDTVPNSTLAAFKEHGEARRSLDEQVDRARAQLQQLEDAGIDLDQVTRELEVEGVEAFAKSYESLARVLKDEARAIKAGKGPRQWHNLATLQPAVDGAVARLQADQAPRRLWAKDSTLWSQDPAKREQIRNRLGWLNVAEQMLEQVSVFRDLAQEGRTFSDVVLLGMGGSSLCPDVLRHTFGAIQGHPELHVLDTTDPGTILKLRAQVRLQDTLLIVASKSGETTETASHFAYFWDDVSRAAGGKSGRQFAAITDAGTPLERLARDQGFRHIFLNPPDIGGRYSALSYFGLVPAALMGVDVGALLERAVEMMQGCDVSIPVEKNPGLWLGAVLGQLANMGRNKATLVLSPRIGTFGFWLEQLLAESTGKEGKGIIPIEGEPLGPPEAYGNDRLFVHLRMGSDRGHTGVEALERGGHPVVTLTLRDKLDLGSEFLRWEVATAIAGSVLGIDPFDQPNVQESKDNTRKVLAAYEATGKLADAETIAAAQAGPPLMELLQRAGEGAYFALMAYTARTGTSEQALARIRTAVRDRRKIATTAGYGPRFLHSTGQLHKGGPRSGIFLQIVQEDAQDAAIPGQPYGFSVLKQAQALGDVESLRSRGLPVLRVNLGRSVTAGWKRLAHAIEAAVR